MSVQLIDSFGRVVGHAENTETGVEVVVPEGVDLTVTTVEGRE